MPILQMLSRLQSLPTLPGAVSQLSRLLADEDSDAADFEAVIKPDPALTANLLRLSNSAYFGRRTEIASVRQAIAVLGLRRVFELAAGVGFARAVPAYLPGYRLRAADFWRHSAAVAVLAERLARRIGLHKLDFVFTAGLLHDIGKLVIGAFLEEGFAEIRPLLDEESRTFLDAERTILQTDHTVVGELLARHWQLPETIVQTVRWHHEPERGDAPIRQLNDLVHMANGLAHSLGYGCDTGELSRREDPQAGLRLGLQVRTLEAVAAESAGAIEEMCGSFR
ncbi:MAG: HDOD domain-containing protein [Myxococcales bacterium]|nr:HDOD domain-containing protein [Myxococcales bacterium]